jgi:RNA processing factor Prp31
MNNQEIILWNIQESKQRIKKAILKDRIVIFFTRVLEDLRTQKNPNFYNRIKDLHHILFPFDKGEATPKAIMEKMRFDKLNKGEGLNVDNEENKHLKWFIENIDKQGRCKNINEMTAELEKIQKEIVVKYLPNSAKLIEPFILGKMISSMGGIDRIAMKSAGTIQLIGAEKALFRHMANKTKTSSPKHGLVFYSTKIKNSKEKGKDARTLANKLAIALRMDYYRNFPQPLSLGFSSLGK